MGPSDWPKWVIDQLLYDGFHRALGGHKRVLYYRLETPRINLFCHQLSY